MREAALVLQKETQFDVVILSLQHLDDVTDVNQIAQLIAQELMDNLGLEKPSILHSAHPLCNLLILNNYTFIL